MLDETVYCKNCGQETKAERYKRFPEYYDVTQGRFIWDFRSICCKDELSEDPVTDVCAMCGGTAEMDGEGFEEVDGDKMCPRCKREYRKEHPDMEEEIAEAEYREYR